MEKLFSKIFGDEKIVVITGAGISTLSGLSDFRGNNGLYKKYANADYKLSLECLLEEPDVFYEFYKNNLISYDLEPNIVHYMLAEFEELGYIDYIITQNIDGLHQKAGSKNVVELHGNGDTFYCNRCKKKYDIYNYLNTGYICRDCGGIIRPDIVLYGEFIKQHNRFLALEKLLKADTVLILGSSLTVTTISNLLNEYIKYKKIEFNSHNLIIINENETCYDNYGLTYSENLEKVFKKIKKYSERSDN